MGNRDRGCGGGGGGVRGNNGSANTFECDVGLGLKMQQYPESNRGSFSSSFGKTSPHHHPYHQQTNGSNLVLGGAGSGSGYNFSYSDSGYGYQSSSLYDSQLAAPSSSVLLSKSNLLQPSSDTGGDAGDMGLFTANQWQELQRQTNICNYMMAQIPVPPNLLSSTPLLPAALSKSKSGGGSLDLRFPSSGSDPEPWRCRRTDGKKWRCSRDIAPDHKYCERHAHKNRPRSRKHVEATTTTTANTTTNNPVIRAKSAITTFQHKPTNNLSNMGSAKTTYNNYEQPQRYSSELLTTNGGSGTSVSLSTTQQFHELMMMQSSLGGPGPGQGSKRDKNNPSLFHQNYQDIAPTNIGNNNCSLTLSMKSGGNYDEMIDENNTSGIDEKYSKWLFDSEMGQTHHYQWLNSSSSASWMDSGSGLGSGSAAPGGPLGEALCLGIANASATTTSYTNGGGREQGRLGADGWSTTTSISLGRKNPT